MEYRFLAIVEKGSDSYGAYAPDVPGCGGVGDTPEEAIQSLKEAMRLHFETTIEYGEAIPQAAYIGAKFVSVSIEAPVSHKQAS